MQPILKRFLRWRSQEKSVLSLLRGVMAIPDAVLPKNVQHN
jgi:hypothetical protein